MKNLRDHTQNFGSEGKGLIAPLNSNLEVKCLYACKLYLYGLLLSAHVLWIPLITCDAIEIIE